MPDRWSNGDPSNDRIDPGLRDLNLSTGIRSTSVTAVICRIILNHLDYSSNPSGSRPSG